MTILVTVQGKKKRRKFDTSQLLDHLCQKCLFCCESCEALPAQLCHTGICSSGGCSETGAQIRTVLVVQGKNSIYESPYRV